MTAPVCHMSQRSHAKPTEHADSSLILTSVSSTMATRSPKTLLYAVSSSMPVQTHMGHVQARPTGLHATRQPWHPIRPSQLVLSISSNEDCQYSLYDKQPPGLHLKILCTYGVYKSEAPSTKRGHRQRKKLLTGSPKCNGHQDKCSSSEQQSFIHRRCLSRWS